MRFGFTQPYMFDRPLQFGFNVYYTKTKYDQARQLSILGGQTLNLPNAVLQNLQNYTQQSAGFTTSLSYPLHRSFKRLGITYSFDRSSLAALSTASRNLFEFLAFRGISGPDRSGRNHHQQDLSQLLLQYAWTVRSRPITGTSSHWERRSQGWEEPFDRSVRSFSTRSSFRCRTGGMRWASTFRGRSSPALPVWLRRPSSALTWAARTICAGFDIRSVSPVAFLPNVGSITLTNPDGTPVPRDPQNPRAGNVTIPIPIDQITFPGGDLSIVTNMEYRITIYGPVALAPFIDLGIDPIVRRSQLQIAQQQFLDVTGTIVGCPVLSQTATANTCALGSLLTPKPSQDLQVLGSTNWRPRMSTGLELQMFLPVVNAPFRIYWAYNPLRLDNPANPPIPITRGMFPSGNAEAAGNYTYNLAKNTYSPSFLLREPRKTFRFTVATTF